MAVLHRALFTWFLLLVFLIKLVLRLDSRTHWNWFIVFIPLWIYDTILLIYVVFHMILHCKNGRILLSNTMKRKAWYIVALILKMSFQILLCLKLENPKWEISMFYVMIPLWILLPIILIDVFVSLIRSHTAFV